MLDRDVVQEFIEDKFEENEIQIPKAIKILDLTEAFYLYIEDDYYEWLKDNYNSFFEGFDWNWIKERIQHYKKTYKENFEN
jgi:hypothetical protein